MKIKYAMIYLFIILPTIIVSATGDSGGGGATFENPLGGVSDIPALLSTVVHLLVQIGIPVLVIFIVYAGLKYVTAQGSPEKIKEAHQALFWAVIGGAVLLGAEIISRVIQATVAALQ